ncbi:FAD-dependent oxidoreductase [Nocardia lijiangensis]|uniref:FAD-dependent oxidoreductase n=1 Tax=Nocardia lijiangensis TaxID=299618 RepID=UPI003D7427AB
MPHVITQACCNDASCVAVCPVGCIRPGPDEPGFATTEMLYIDPATCIDCGVCVPTCPVGAIARDSTLTGIDTRYIDINAAYYEHNPISQSLAPVDLPAPVVAAGAATLRVAVVGSGPAGSYAAQELLGHPGIEVNMFDRLPTPGGLIRAGVAPDHPATKSVAALFEPMMADYRFGLYLDVEIGTHLSHADLLEHHHAVIYAHGASGDRRLGIPGEDLPGSVSATEFVNWYNGHPDYAERSFDLSGTRAVIIGNGNVALDIARILVADPNRLARTDMADHAVNALRDSNIEEVLVIGRRGPAQAAYTTPELLALSALPGIDVITDPAEATLDAVSRTVVDDPSSPASLRHKVQLVAEYATRPATPGNHRILLRYLAAPVEILGHDRVTGLRIARNRLDRNESGTPNAVPTGVTEDIETGLVLRAVGYRGAPMPDLPFDNTRAVLPNDAGRVHDPDTNIPLIGVYVTGWIKRGPSGVIGTNKSCAQQTVAALLADHAAGLLRAPTTSTAQFTAWMHERRPDLISLTGWRAIDSAERQLGQDVSKPRSKITTFTELRTAAHFSPSPSP